MTPLFTDAMALRRVRETSTDGKFPANRPVIGAVFEAELNRHWTIGPKVHGGAMLALCANAARIAVSGILGDDAGWNGPWGSPRLRGRGGTSSREAAWGRAGQLGTVEPVAVSGTFLWAPDPGPMRLATSIRKRGRRISVVDVELYQGDRTAVHAVITLGEPESRARPLLCVNPVVDLMAPEPPADVAPIGPGHPMAGLVHLAEGCDVRPLVSTLEPTDGRAPLIQMWVRPRGAAPDVLFALMCGDVSAPVSFAVNRTGWAPTVQLTAYLRGLPADGWLRVLCTCTQIGQDWFDEDHTVVDCEGRIVVQSRQLAMVPGR